MPKLRMNQAIAKAIAEEMRANPDVMLMGEDIAQAGGPFKTSEGFLDEFGSNRVRDTPISEMGFLGAAVGAAAMGLRPVVEIMFIEFLGVALDQLHTEAAKLHYLSAGGYSVPLVLRASIGAGAGFACQHSQTLEGWLMNAPGLKVCVPSGARSAYGLIKAAIRDDDPVVILEPRVLYGTREDVDTESASAIRIGTAEVLKEGSDVTLVGLGQTVQTIRQAADKLPWSAEVIDLRTLVPWDRESLYRSIAKTGVLVIVEENPYTGGWGAQVSADIAQHRFESLKAPILRITGPDTHVPFNIQLEREFVPSADYVTEQVTSLIETGAPPKPWWKEVA